MATNTTDRAEKARENRLRRMSERRGLTLRKSRRRDPGALDYGAYWLIRGDKLATPERGLTLDGIEEHLKTLDRRKGATSELLVAQGRVPGTRGGW
jgi:hypothetical protein